MKQKNRLSVFVIVIFSLFYETFTQQWVNISPFPESNIGIFGNFISENEGWIKQSNLAVEQAIYHTNDGGKSWGKIYTQSDQLGYFTMVDHNNGWLRIITADRHLYKKTIDGGYTWEDMTEFMPIESDEYYPFYFINKDIGFISTGVDSIDLSAQIYKTVDGGYSWYLTYTPPLDYYGYDYPYAPSKFFFLDEMCGWATCYGEWDTGLAIKTIDGGESWLLGLLPEHNYLMDIHFSNSQNGGTVSYFPAGSSSEVIITEDNFENIKHYYHNEWNQYPKAICFQNDTTIWVTGQPGIINRSTNGGATFDSQQTIDADLNKIQFFNNIGYIFGSNNNALYRYDGESSIEHENEISGCVLYQNYPNPFNPVTRIEYFIKDINQIVSLSIYDVKGNLVYEIFKEKKHNKGKYSVSWEGNDKNEKEVGNGIYFYKLEVGKQSVTKSMLLLK